MAFESKKLNPAERNYPVHDIELLAIVHCLKKWRHLLEGLHFTVRTDNAALTHLFTQVSLNGRQVRSISCLQEFSFDIVHVKGMHNEVADALSRLPHPVQRWGPDEAPIEPQLPTPGKGGLLGDWGVDLEDLEFGERAKPRFTGDVLMSDDVRKGVAQGKGESLVES